MEIRKFEESNKSWLIIAAVVVILVAGYFIIRNYTVSDLPHQIDRVYFSDDGGKTYFVDAASKGFAFLHGAKPAQRVFVYRCGSGEPFVGVLVRLADVKPPETLPSTEPTTAPTTAPTYPGPEGQAGNSAAAGPAPALEICKPGTTAWVLASSPEGVALINSICPSGDSPESVFP